MIKESIQQPAITAESGLEGEVQDLLSQLPNEIAERWEETNQKTPLEIQRENLLQLISKRQDAMRRNYSNEMSPEHIETVEENPIAILNVIKKLEAGEHMELGAGRAARVITSARNPDTTCYKVMFPSTHIPPVPPETNDISVEADIQDSISKLGEMHGVRVPAVYSYVKNDSVRAIAMQRIEGPTLHDVLTGKEPPPEDFVPSVFHEALTKYIQALHEKGYYHRDLHDGNILIDADTGMPWVIDFGASIYTHFSEDIYRQEVIKDGKKVIVVLPSDTGNLKKLANDPRFIKLRDHRNTGDI